MGRVSVRGAAGEVMMMVAEEKGGGGGAGRGGPGKKPHGANSSRATAGDRRSTSTSA